MFLLSSIQVKIHGSVHELIAININLQLVWHFSDDMEWPRLWSSFKLSQSVIKSMLLLFGCCQIGVNYVHLWPPPQSKMVVLQLYACCEPGWSRRLFTEKCNHWEIWAYKKHSEISEFHSIVNTMMETKFQSNNNIIQWGLRYCNLRYGEVFRMMGEKSNADVLVHLAETVHYSVGLQILCQLPLYTREDTSASLELLKGS